MTQPGSPAKKPKGALVTGIVLVALSVVVVIIGIVWGAVALATTVSDAQVFRAPGQITVTLDAGDHALWTPTTGEYLFANEVTITGPSGEIQGVDYISSNSSVSVSKGGDTYTPEVTFNAPSTGAYTFAVGADGPRTDVMVGPSTDTVTRSFVIIAAAFGVASLVGIVGVILFIVGLVQRSRARKAASPPGGGYPGGPPPYGQPTYPPPSYPQPGSGPPPGQGPYGQPPAGPGPTGPPPS